MNNEFLTLLDDTIKIYDSRRAKNNLMLVLPFGEQIKLAKQQPIGKYLNPDWNKSHTTEIIRCYLYGEIMALDDLIQTLQSILQQIKIKGQLENVKQTSEHVPA